MLVRPDLRVFKVPMDSEDPLDPLDRRGLQVPPDRQEAQVPPALWVPLAPLVLPGHKEGKERMETRVQQGSL